MQHQTETTHVGDFSWKDFVALIYKEDPKPSHTYAMQFLDEIPPKALKQYLAYFIIYGAKTLYKKELAQLSEIEIGKLRQYLLSLGWNIEYKLDSYDLKQDDGTTK